MPSQSIWDVSFITDPEHAKRVKYVLTDIDDTLTTGGVLPQSVCDAARRLSEVGVTLILISGRPIPSFLALSRYVFDRTNLPMIGENGATFALNSDMGPIPTCGAAYDMANRRSEIRARIENQILPELTSRLGDLEAFLVPDVDLRTVDFSIGPKKKDGTPFESESEYRRALGRLGEELRTLLNGMHEEFPVVSEEPFVSSIHAHITAVGQDKGLSASCLIRFLESGGKSTGNCFQEFTRHWPTGAHESFSTLSQVMVLGDSSNDLPIFHRFPGRGIIIPSAVRTEGKLRIKSDQTLLEHGKPAAVAPLPEGDGWAAVIEVFLKSRGG